MRAVFLGTPDFAVPSLRALAASHQVVAAFTQPDRPKGRGNALNQSPVKLAAAELGIPVHQPERVRRPESFELLKSFAADVMVVVGYGQIIPQSIIDLPRHGILNVHASLLPRYRGAAPIQWAIANGEHVTGVTIMRIDAGLDTGDMLLRSETEIGSDEAAPQLSERLATSGAQLLIQALEQIATGTSVRLKQTNAEATLAPILKKQDGLIDWGRPASATYARLRGFTPWPGAYSSFRGQQLSVLEAGVAGRDDAEPGVVYRDKRRLYVGCGEGSVLELLTVQPAGKNRMSAEAFLNGYKVTENERLGEAS